MAEFQEEVYIIEKQEITDDEDEDVDIGNQEDSDDDIDLNADLNLDDESDDDLDDFNALQQKVNEKMAKRAKETGVSTKEQSMGAGSYRKELRPAAVERPVVIDDFIRNFLTKLQMQKTMNTF